MGLFLCPKIFLFELLPFSIDHGIILILKEQMKQRSFEYDEHEHHQPDQGQRHVGTHS